jgi:hypothetical protein
MTASFPYEYIMRPHYPFASGLTRHSHFGRAFGDSLLDDLVSRSPRPSSTPLRQHAHYLPFAPPLNLHTANSSDAQKSISSIIIRLANTHPSISAVSPPQVDTSGYHALLLLCTSTIPNDTSAPMKFVPKRVDDHSMQERLYYQEATAGGSPPVSGGGGKRRAIGSPPQDRPWFPRRERAQNMPHAGPRSFDGSPRCRARQPDG